MSDLELMADTTEQLLAEGAQEVGKRSDQDRQDLAAFERATGTRGKVSRTAERSREDAEESWLGDDDRGGQRAQDEGDEDEAEITFDDDEEGSPSADDEGEDEPELSVEQLVALRRANVPDSIIQSMDPGHLVEWAEELRSFQATTDGAGESERPARSAAPAQQNGRAAEASAPDLRELIKPLLKELGLEEEASGALEQFGQGIIAAARSGAQDLQSSVTTALQVAGGIVLSGARERLRAEYPSLAKPAVWGRVKAKVQELYRTGAYSTGDLTRGLERAVEDASLLTLGRRKARASRDPRRGKRRGSTRATRRPASKAKPRTLSKRERDAAVFRAAVHPDHVPGDLVGLQRRAGV